MKVFVSAGHGGSDPGAIGNGLKEKDCNLQIALAFGKVLQSEGIDVVYSRTCDENDPVTSEVNEANRAQANYAISFHNNAGGGVGSETYVWPGDNNAYAIAKAFEDVTISLGGKSRGVKTTTSLYFIRNTHMTAVLNETAFIDSADHTRIDTADKCAAIGTAYAQAFLNLMGYNVSNTGAYPKTPFQFKADGNTPVFDWDSGNKMLVMHITDKRRYTIVEVDGDYGLLKSKAGWVYLPDVEIMG